MIGTLTSHWFPAKILIDLGSNIGMNFNEYIFKRDIYRKKEAAQTSGWQWEITVFGK